MINLDELERLEREALETPAVLLTNDFAGWHEWPCRIVFNGETPKRYRIRVLQDTKLAGRNRWALKGDVIFVPKTAVRIDAALSPAKEGG